MISQTRYVEIKDSLRDTRNALRRCFNYIWHYQIRNREMLEKVSYIDTDGASQTVLISVASGVALSRIEDRTDANGERWITHHQPERVVLNGGAK